MNEEPVNEPLDDPPPESPTDCDFCRMSIPTEPIYASLSSNDETEPLDAPVEPTSEDDNPQIFCSEACRDALGAAELDFSKSPDHRRIRPSVSAFDVSLPQGFPRNAFVLMSGEAGTRDRAVQAELVWRTLQRGEPAIIVSLQEPPGSVVQQFLTLEWNVLPYLERGQLHIVDAFTYRVGDRDRMFERMDEWNRHLYNVAGDATTTVRDPSDLGELLNKVDNAMKAREMIDDGLVLVDSLTELGTLVQPVQAYNFVKDLRADVCKGRFVPVFAGATLSGAREEFPHDLEYVVDGVIEMRLNQEIITDALIKQARIRKLNGVLVIPEWHAYEYTSGTGMVLFDPEEEQEKSRKATEEHEQTTAEQADEDSTRDTSVMDGKNRSEDENDTATDPTTNADTEDSSEDSTHPAEAANRSTLDSDG